MSSDWGQPLIKKKKKKKQKYKNLKKIQTIDDWQQTTFIIITKMMSSWVLKYVKMKAGNKKFNSFKSSLP